MDHSRLSQEEASGIGRRIHRTKTRYEGGRKTQGLANERTEESKDERGERRARAKLCRALIVKRLGLNLLCKGRGKEASKGKDMNKGLIWSQWQAR